MRQLTLFVTGEGPTDIGTIDYQSGEFLPGAMTHIVTAVIRQSCDDVGLDYRFTSERDLSMLLRAESSFKRQPVVSGRGTKGKEFSGYWFRARAFAVEVCGKERSKPHAPIAILFADTDGTHSALRHQCEKKYEAILNGFLAGGCDYGVPMVPRPKSEAWLLAYYQKNLMKGSSSYQNCARFEELAGNDDSQPKNSAKHILSALLNGRQPSEDELLSVDWNRVDMPSFNRFKARMREVLSAAISSRVGEGR